MIRIDRVRALLAKDLAETFSTAQIMGPLVVVPLMIIIGYPVGFLLAIRFAPDAMNSLKDFIASFPASAVPAIPGLTSAGRVAYIGVVYLFAGFFLIVPVMVSTVIAANSFAGEKERRTLKGLLYTPLSDAELVFGKIGGVVPAGRRVRMGLLRDLHGDRGRSGRADRGRGVLPDRELVGARGAARADGVAVHGHDRRARLHEGERVSGGERDRRVGRASDHRCGRRAGGRTHGAVDGGDRSCVVRLRVPRRRAAVGDRTGV